VIGWEHSDPKAQPVFYRLKMTPVTVGHLALLYELGVDVLDGMTEQDERLAAFVCSGDHIMRSRDVRRFWIKPFFRLWGSVCGRHGIITEPEFWPWFAKQLSGPITKRKSGSIGGEIAAPLHVHLIACCMGMLGMTKAEAMNLTVKEAKQLICALGEARGEIDSWTRADERRRELSVSLGLLEARN
jgi:hypothetical protein